MDTLRKKIVAGNWKMNGDLNSLKEIACLEDSIREPSCDVIICPPVTLLTEAIKLIKKSFIIIGAQNCHHKTSGAHTGEISAKMLKDLGVRIVILGHSERRVDNYESNALINQKAKAAHECNLKTIICVGETEIERKKGKTEKIIKQQVTESLPNSATEDNTIIAYEPIWAIGTGITPTSHEILNVHMTLRTQIERLTTKSLADKIRILYGGSVNTSNSSEIFCIDGVDGALVGGASLLASDFSNIIKSAY